MVRKTFNRKTPLHDLLLVLGFIAFLTVTFLFSWKYFVKRAEEDVSNTKPEYFPVVVVTPNKSELVFVEELKKYKQSVSTYTFLASDENLVNQQLKKAQSERRGKGIPQISVKSISEGKQLIEVKIGGDGLFNAKYEATDREFKPLTLTTSGPLFVLLPCASTVFFGFVGFGILNLILWWLNKRENIALV